MVRQERRARRRESERARRTAWELLPDLECDGVEPTARRQTLPTPFTAHVLELYPQRLIIRRPMISVHCKCRNTFLFASQL